MKKLILSITLVVAAFSSKSQIADGSVAPNFTATDLNGNSHTLYDYLAAGKTVIIDVSATWCGPCWSYHNTHALKNLYNAYGPDGSDQIMVFYVEGDASTSIGDLHGTGGNTQGDWVTGTPYPILDNASIGDLYQITYFPTVYRICPDGFVYEVGQLTSSQFVADISSNCGTTLTNVQNNVEIFGTELIVCATDEAPTVTFENYGSNAITTASFVIKENGTTIVTQPFTGNVPQFGSGTINFPLTSFNGVSTYTAEVATVNGVLPYNTNISTSPIEISYIGGPGVVLPYTNSFLTSGFPYSNWALENTGGVDWTKVTTSQGCLKYSVFGGNNGTAQFYVEPIDLSTGTVATLNFNVAHARLNSSISDKLEVLVSTDCGATWVTKWSKMGADLSTAPSTTNAFTPTSSQWRTECIDLSEFIGNNTVNVKFKGYDYNGNNIFVDGLNFSNNACVLSIEEEAATETFNVYPNPASDVLNVSFEAKNSDYVVTILDLQGRVIATQAHTDLTGSQNLSFTVNDFAKGSYIVTISTNGVTTSKNVVIK